MPVRLGPRPTACQAVENKASTVSKRQSESKTRRGELLLLLMLSPRDGRRSSRSCSDLKNRRYLPLNSVKERGSHGALRSQPTTLNAFQAAFFLPPPLPVHYHSRSAIRAKQTPKSTTVGSLPFFLRSPFFLLRSSFFPLPCCPVVSWSCCRFSPLLFAPRPLLHSTGGSLQSKRIIQILSAFNCRFIRPTTR